MSAARHTRFATSVVSLNTVADFGYNPAEYTHVDSAGTSHLLSTLSREDLMQLACRGIDAIEKLDLLVDSQLSVINSWRQNEQLPDVAAA